MKKKLILGGVLIALAALPVAPSLASEPVPTNPTGVEGCVVQANDSCTYTAKRSGGYVGNGDFLVTVVSGAITKTYSHGDAVCTGVIAAGDVVTVKTGATGQAPAGNPLPAAGDGTLPPTGPAGTETCRP
jgi:chitodextrinase